MKKYVLDTSDPRKLSLFVSVLISFFTGFLYSVSCFVYDSVSFHFTVALFIVTGNFLFSYFVFKFILRKFIYDKIRLIYKTVRNLKLQKEEKPDMNLNSDIIKEVKEEVEVWGEEHKREISTLKERETFRREYIGNISHELKNPIFNIQGYIYSLMHGAAENPELLKKYLKRTNKNVERIITIIEDLDTISELEITDLKTNFKNFDILRTAKDVVDLFVDKAAEKNINIFFRERYLHPLNAEGDENRIKQVFINLIDNAIKYGFENTRIKISFFDMDSNYLIEITDEGPGIPEEDLPRIFERFYRTDKARSRDKGGSGLGLSIVKHIIEAHNQTINVRSTVGVGTTFAFTVMKA
ncbi:MAG: GHKL domain-containing protein [Chlorobi bacterium]|nr:GHKL domain-containing protein [Chlorobiota bacterium]